MNKIKLLFTLLILLTAIVHAYAGEYKVTIKCADFGKPLHYVKWKSPMTFQLYIKKDDAEFSIGYIQFEAKSKDPGDYAIFQSQHVVMSNRNFMVDKGGTFTFHAYKDYRIKKAVFKDDTEGSVSALNAHGYKVFKRGTDHPVWSIEYQYFDQNDPTFKCSDNDNFSFETMEFYIIDDPEEELKAWVDKSEYDMNVSNVFTPTVRYDKNDFKGTVTLNSLNPDVISVFDGKLVGGSQSGKATIEAYVDNDSKYKGTKFSYVVNYDATMSISSADDWEKFAQLVNPDFRNPTKDNSILCAKLTKDIHLTSKNSSVNPTIGYRGTFDGQGHTIYLDKVHWDDGNSLFNTTRHATIKNLNVTGNVSYSGANGGGIVYLANNTTFTKCRVDVKIRFDTKVKAKKQKIGGFVGTGTGNTYNDCLYKNPIEKDDNRPPYMQIDMSDNLFIGPGTLHHSLTICKDGSVTTKSNILNSRHEDFVHYAHDLQDNRDEVIWGMEIGKDTFPDLTTDRRKLVWKVSFLKDGREAAVRYANDGKCVTTLPTLEEIFGSFSSYSNVYYKMTFDGGFSGSTPVTHDTEVNVNYSQTDYLPIYSVEDLLKMGPRTNAKLETNIDFSEYSKNNDWTPIREYIGDFDGNGFEIINFNQGRQEQNAYPLFSRISTGTVLDGLKKKKKAGSVKNVRFRNAYVSSNEEDVGMIAGINNGTIELCQVEGGRVDGGNKTKNIGCLVGYNSGRIIGCISDNVLSNNKDILGGIAGENKGGTIMDCVCYTESAINSINKRYFKAATIGTGLIRNICSQYSDGFDEEYGYYNNVYFNNGFVLTKVKGMDVGQLLGVDNCPKLRDINKIEADRYITISSNGTGFCRNFTIKDGQPLNLGINVLVEKLNYDRQFTAGNGYCTVFLPFSMHSDERLGTFYEYRGINEDETGVVLARVSQTEPNKPYIFKPAEGRDGMKLLEHRYVELSPTNLENPEREIGLNGCFTRYEINHRNYEGCFGFAGSQQGKIYQGKFVRFVPGSWIDTGRAYIYAPRVRAKSLDIIIEDEATTGISSTEIQMEQEGAQLYNLSGQKVGKNYKGIVVRNGKKVFIK